MVYLDKRGYTVEWNDMSGLEVSIKNGIGQPVGPDEIRIGSLCAMEGRFYSEFKLHPGCSPEDFEHAKNNAAKSLAKFIYRDVIDGLDEIKTEALGGDQAGTIRKIDRLISKLVEGE